MTLPRKESLDARAVWNWFQRKISVVQARRNSKRRSEAAAAQRVLVVCHGNIYRSPFAAALLEKEMGGCVDVRSAGFHPEAGRRVSEVHIGMCQAFGVRLDDHVSSVVDKEATEWADTIVLMDSYNWIALRNLGVASNKLLWLGAFDDGPVEIPDPRGLPGPLAEPVLVRIASCAHALAELLMRSTAPL